jgi:pimeloyl-ACP methyl ester carboxylesterase
MATFVLIHGAWHGGWCWKNVIPILRSAGHDVFTPSLTGLGSRAHLAHPGIRLDTHIEDVIGVIESEDLQDVILCGHSYAGMVITGAADRIADRVNTLIYLDAFVPESGASMMSFYSPEKVSERLKEAGQTGEGWKVQPLSAKYFGVLREEDADWIDRHCTPQPILTQIQAIDLSGNWKLVSNKVFIEAENHPQDTFRDFAARFRADPAWSVYGLPCGHEIMIDLPEELAAIFLEIADKA